MCVHIIDKMLLEIITGNPPTMFQGIMSIIYACIHVLAMKRASEEEKENSNKKKSLIAILCSIEKYT